MELDQPVSGAVVAIYFFPKTDGRVIGVFSGMASWLRCVTGYFSVGGFWPFSGFGDFAGFNIDDSLVGGPAGQGGKALGEVG